MKVTTDTDTINLGTTASAPTIGITDYSRRVTDDFGVTTVVERGFSRRLSVRLSVPFERVDTIQRQLAALRATAATWVAGEGPQALTVRGFYKDFQVDVQSPPVSSVTLTVEGLAETTTAPDDGTDPAATGASTLRVLVPATIGDAQLASSSVPEDDAPTWVSGTTYPIGSKVIRAHRVWENGAAAAGDDPLTLDGKWLDTGPTNRWAALDQALGTATTRMGSIVFMIANAGPIGAVALLDVTGAMIRVQAPGYARDQPVAAGPITFLDLPDATTVTVTITGPAHVSVGTLLVGRLRGLGVTEAAPTAGITDFSRKDVDEFGEVTVVERAWAKRMAARALIRTDAVDQVFNRVAAVRALPCLWIARAGMDALTIYGFWREFQIEHGRNVSKLSLSIEGLSEAAKLKPIAGAVDWPSVGDPDGTKPADNADVTGDNVAKDTAAVGGKPATEVVASLAVLTKLDTETVPLINQAIVDANTAIANARNDAAEAVDEVTTLLAQARADLTRADQVLKERIDALVVEGGGYDDSGLRAAIERIDAALIAGDKAVAQQIAAVKATSAGGMANRNPAFADLTARDGAVTTMQASRWGYWWSPPTDASRQPGTVSEWAWLMRAEAAQRTGLACDYSFFEPGWAVLDIAWDLWDGQLSGAGVHISLADADGTELATVPVSLTSLAYQADQAAVGTIYKPLRRTRLIKLEGAFRKVALVGALNFEVHGPLAYKQLAWHHIGIRRASDAEIKAGRASAELIPELDARVGREETARADGDTALGRRVDTVTTDYKAADRELNTRVDDTVTAMVDGDRALADRQSVTEASARAVPDLLNRNASFSDWPDGQYLPSRYSGAAAPNSVSRVPGKVGRWAMRQVFGPGQGGVSTFLGATGDATRWSFDDPMVWDSGLNVAPGRFVLMADVELEQGQLIGSGMYAAGYDSEVRQYQATFVDFSLEKNPDGSQIGAGVVGRRYRFSKLIDLTHPAIRFLRLHPLTSHPDLGRGVYPYKGLIWHLFGIRPATPEEIAANAASGDITDLVARADSAVAALVDLEAKKATVQSVDTLRAEAGEAIGLVDDRVDVVAEQERLTAQSLQTLSGQYGDTKVEVTRQAGIIADKLGAGTAFFRYAVAAGSAVADMTAVADAGSGVSAFRLRASNIILDGDAVVTGTLGLSALARSQFSCAATYGIGNGSPIQPPRGETRLLLDEPLGTIGEGGTFTFVLYGEIRSNAGTSMPGTHNGRPLRVDYIADGGLQATVERAGAVLASVGSAVEVPNYAPAGPARMMVRLIQGAFASEPLFDPESNSYTQQQSATYTFYSASFRARWVFV